MKFSSLKTLVCVKYVCVTGVYSNDATKRQIAETVKIKEKGDLTIMNKEEESRHTILLRLVLFFYSVNDIINSVHILFS